MDETMQAQNERRAEIARKQRQRIANAHDRRLMMAIFCILAYLGGINLFGGAIAMLGDATGGAIATLSLGVVTGYIAWRVWSRDETRWWVIGTPLWVLLTFGVVYWLQGLIINPIPLLLSAIAVAIAPFRSRALAIARAVKTDPDAETRPSLVQSREP